MNCVAFITSFRDKWKSLPLRLYFYSFFRKPLQRRQSVYQSCFMFLPLRENSNFKMIIFNIFLPLWRLKGIRCRPRPYRKCLKLYIECLFCCNPTAAEASTDHRVLIKHEKFLTFTTQAASEACKKVKLKISCKECFATWMFCYFFRHKLFFLHAVGVEKCCFGYELHFGRECRFNLSFVHIILLWCN